MACRIVGTEKINTIKGKTQNMNVGEKLLGQMKPLESKDVFGVDGSMEVQKKPGSVGMESLRSDPDMIKYAEKNLPDLGSGLIN
jgi:hypothetical protein